MSLMNLVVQMNTQRIFNIFFLLLIVSLHPVAGYSAGGSHVVFKTRVVVGTCEFDESNDFNKNVNLTKINYLMVSDVEKTEIKKPIITETFTYTVKCKNFPSGSLKDIKIQMLPANNTDAENGIYFSHNDETQTGFILKACDSNNENCQNSDANNGVAVFQSDSDDVIAINYHVSLVKRKSGVSPGISTASVSLIYLQD